MFGSKSDLVTKSAEFQPMNLDANELRVLRATSLKFTRVTSNVVTCINFINVRALTHRQFHKFPEDTGA